MSFARNIITYPWDVFVNPILAIPLAAIGAIVLGRLGNGLGLDRLFWNDKPTIRWQSGSALALLMVTSILVGFLLVAGISLNADHPFEALLYFTMINITRLAPLLVLSAIFGHRRTVNAATQSKSTVAPLRASLDRPSALNISYWQLPAGFLITLLVALTSLFVLQLYVDSALENHFPKTGFLDYSRTSHPGGLTQSPLIVLHALAAVIVAINAFYWVCRIWLGSTRATPAVALCSLASAISLIVGMLEFYHVSLLFPLFGIFALGVIAAYRNGPYTFPIANLAYGKQDLKSLATAGTQTSRPTLAATGHQFSTATNSRRLPLVIVCCSGGGIRAGIWTLRTLMQLRVLTGFDQRVRLIFGASGGMLGAMRYVTWLNDSKNISPDDAIAQVEKDALSRLASQLIFHDIPKAVVPFIHGQHRGDVIEDNWRDNFGWEKHLTFNHLVSKELAGEIPSIVLSPMMIEDGRRLLLSNLDLSPLVQCHGPELKDSSRDQLYSQSAVEFRQLFGEKVLADNLRLLSAVRLNASFPFVMPASSIPTKPRRRIVDAGYYDNYGVGLAADWLQYTMNDPERKAWLREQTSGVLVVQIRDGVLDLTQPINDTSGPLPNPFTQSVEPLMGPIQGILGFKTAVQLFDNDSRLSRILDRINIEFKSGADNSSDFATSAAFEFGLEASLTWALSKEEKNNLKLATNTPEFNQRVSVVKNWWESRM